MRILSATALAMLTVALSSCGSTASGAGEAAAAGPLQTKDESTVIFVKYTEAKEQAWTMLLPKGWKAEGGIFRVDPVSTGDAANAIAAKVDFTVKKDDKGAVMIRWLPDMYYVDSSYTPAGQMGMFPEGSRMNGMLVKKCPTAKDFLVKQAFPKAHPNAEDLKVVSSAPQADVIRAIKEFAKTVPLMNQFRYDSALVTVTYSEGGTKYKEFLFAVIENMGQIGGGMWQNKMTVCARAPEADVEKWSGVASLIFSSVRLNPTWVKAQIQGETQRTQTYMETQQAIRNLDKEIIANQQKTYAEINNDMFLVLTGQEEFVNPYTGETEVRPDGWKYHWQNEAGEIVVTNNGEYDPNLDVELKRTDFKRSKVRER